MGDKRYELSNHLGNVLSVVSDRKLFQNTLSFTTFAPDVLSYSDYYPFGMLVPNRHKAGDDYRYGFQGQEKDDEIRGGEGNSLNYTFRMHDPRVGRFFAVDPLFKEYPHYTPYSFSGNKVIAFREREGLEEEAVAAFGGPLGWAYIAFKWSVIGYGTYVTVQTADKVINNYKNAPSLETETITSPEAIKPKVSSEPSQKPNTKPKPISPYPIVAPKNKDKVKEKVNLDSGTVRAMLDGSSFDVEAAVFNKKMVITTTAFEEVSLYAEKYDKQKELAILLKARDIKTIPDNPSERAMSLTTTRKVGENDKIIFGTGDKLNIKTISSDAKFVSGASAQGVDFDVIIHEPIKN